MKTRWDRRPQVEKVLKALYVRKLFLWPRFHSAVREVLEAEGLNAEVRSGEVVGMQRGWY